MSEVEVKALEWRIEDGELFASTCFSDNYGISSWNAGYLAGFMASGEGWNGEYPFEFNDALADEYWLKCREEFRAKAETDGGRE